MKAWLGLFSILFVMSGCKVRDHNDADALAAANKEYMKNSCPSGYVRKKIRELKVTSFFDWRNFTSAGSFVSETSCKPIVNEAGFKSVSLEPQNVAKMWEDLDYTKVGFNDGFAASCVDSSLAAIPDSEKAYYNTLSDSEKKRVRRNIVTDVYYLTRVLQDSVRSRTEIIGGLRQVLGKQPFMASRLTKFAGIEKMLPGSMTHAKQVDKCPADPDGMTVIFAQSELSLKMMIFNKIMYWRVSQYAAKNPNLGLPLDLFPVDLKVARTDFKSVLEYFMAEYQRYSEEAPWLLAKEAKQKYLYFSEEKDYPMGMRGVQPEGKVVGMSWIPQLENHSNRSKFKLDNKIFSQMFTKPSHLIDYLNSRLNEFVASQEFKDDMIKYTYSLVEAHDKALQQSWQIAACAWSNDFDKCEFDKSVIRSSLAEIPDYPLVFKSFEAITGTKFANSFGEKWRANLNDKTIMDDKRKIDFMDYEYSGAMCRYRMNAVSHEVNELGFAIGSVGLMIPLVFAEPLLVGALTSARAVVAGDRIAVALSHTAKNFYIFEWNTAFRAKIYNKVVPVAKVLEKVTTPGRMAILGANVAVNQYFVNEGFKPLQDYCEKLLATMETKNDNLRTSIFRPFDSTEAMCVSVGGDTMASKTSKLKPFTDRLFSNQVSKDSQTCRMAVGMAMTFGALGIAGDTFGILTASTYMKQLPLVRKLAGNPGLIRK